MFHYLLPFDELLAVLFPVEELQTVLDSSELFICGSGVILIVLIMLWVITLIVVVVIASIRKYLPTTNKVTHYPLYHHLDVSVFAQLSSLLLL